MLPIITGVISAINTAPSIYDQVKKAEKLLSRRWANIKNQTPLGESKVTTLDTRKVSAPTQTQKVQAKAQSTTAGKIEHSCWYIDWTSWDFPVPEGVNLVNLFVGKLDVVDGYPSVSGFGTLTDEKLREFVNNCRAKGVDVKVSIGGGGGSYDNCWDVLTDSNVQDYAQGLADYCKQRGIVGVDFDYEEMGDTAQQERVGTLIRKFKDIDPSLQTSYCTNAGFLTWLARNKAILDGATDPSTGKCALDRFYIMTYYDPLNNEQAWTEQWVQWLGDEYGMTPNQIGVGIDNFDAHAYDIGEFAEWAGRKGLSTGYWCWNPADPTFSNISANTILNSYNEAAAPPPYTYSSLAKQQLASDPKCLSTRQLQVETPPPYSVANTTKDDSVSNKENEASSQSLLSSLIQKIRLFISKIVQMISSLFTKAPTEVPPSYQEVFNDVKQVTNAALPSYQEALRDVKQIVPSL